MGGCPASFSTEDTEVQRIRDYQRLLDCAKRSLAEAKARLSELSDGRLDDLATALLNRSRGLEGQFQLQRDRIAELESESHQKDEQISGLNGQVDQLQTHVKDLEAKILRLQGVIDSLEASVKQAHDQIAGLVEENADLKQKIIDLTEEIAGCTAQTATLKEANEDLKRQVAALNEKIAQLEFDIAAKDTEIAALRCHVDRMTSERSAFYSELQQALGNDSRIKIVGDMFVMELDVLFDVGSADLSLEGRQRIDTIAPLVIGLETKVRPGIDWVLQVNGHTDTQKYRFTKKFPRNNWELSVARALSVVTRLEGDKVPGMRLAAAGYSEYRPIDESRTPEALRVNRRVEFKLVEYSRHQDPQKSCPPLPPDPEDEDID